MTEHHTVRQLRGAQYAAQADIDSGIYSGNDLIIATNLRDMMRVAADEIERLRAGLSLINCEPINAEYMAENILEGRDPYFIDYASIKPLP